jgi:hypothetical protein
MEALRASEAQKRSAKQSEPALDAEVKTRCVFQVAAALRPARRKRAARPGKRHIVCLNSPRR